MLEDQKIFGSFVVFSSSLCSKVELFIEIYRLNDSKTEEQFGALVIKIFICIFVRNFFFKTTSKMQLRLFQKTLDQCFPAPFLVSVFARGSHANFCEGVGGSVHSTLATHTYFCRKNRFSS